MDEETAKILVVDDEPNIREPLSDTLRGEGYQVSTAEDGQRALEQVRKIDFDMAIVDIRIPHIGGLEVLHYIRKSKPETMTIMMTGYASLETAVEALREGAYDYLIKPFNMEKLLSVLKRGVREQRLTRENARLSDELKQTYMGVMTSLATAIDAKNHRTQHHSQQVTKYTHIISEKLNLPQEEKEKIGRAASLHDIGKIGIPDPILTKPGSLNDEEWAQIEQHPTRGAEILSPLDFLSEVVPLIRHHHERYTGSGYPDGLKGNDISLGARIISVADAFEAMVSERPYRRALSKEEAIQEIESGLGNQFDPQIGEIFISAVKNNGNILEGCYED